MPLRPRTIAKSKSTTTTTTTISTTMPPSKWAQLATAGLVLIVTVPLWTVAWTPFQVPTMALQAWQQTATVATVATVLLSVSTPSQVLDLTGSYADPNHPNCQRVISAAAPPSATTKARSFAVTLKGTDGNPGCPPDGSGTPWTLTGQVDGSTLSVDFSPKGGPPNLKGQFDASISTYGGIQWPDGNTWTRIALLSHQAGP